MMNLDDIDPEIRIFLDEMRRDWTRFPALSTLTFPEQRHAAEQVRARWTCGGPNMADIHEFLFDTGSGELRLRIYRPTVSPDPQPALIYIHGGGFTLFSIHTHDRLMREYAARGEFAVIGVDYPLAPEAKYPVALDRIEALLRWLGEYGRQWNIDSDRLALGGDSAGGNLSFATFMRLRASGDGPIVKAILSNYGGFSARISDKSEERFGGVGSIMDRAEAEQYWLNYLRDERDKDDSQACPINGDFRDFPPTLLIVPEQDIVAEHSLAVHEAMQAAGADVRCSLYAGATHSFLEAMSISALARQGIEEGADFIARWIR